jgi:hypothetical protein
MVSSVKFPALDLLLWQPTQYWLITAGTGEAGVEELAGGVWGVPALSAAAARNRPALAKRIRSTQRAKSLASE